MYDWYKRDEEKAKRQRRRAAYLEDYDVGSPDHVNISHCLINDVITNVSHVKSGYDKNYVCLGCGKSLIAKKGQIKAHHFAHTSAVDLDSCGYNETTVSRHVETLAHKVGKRIIENGINEIKSISVPAIYKEREDNDVFGNHLKVQLTWPTDVENFSIDYISAQSEVNYGTVKPDVVIETEGQHLLAVEIAVSHFCDNEKTKKLNDLDLPTIEIDLSKVVSDMKKEYGVYFECFQYDERFENYIADGLRDVKNIKWINISKAKQENMEKRLIRLMEHEKAKKQYEYNKKKKEELEKNERERKKSEKEKKFADDVEHRRLNQVDENHTLANQYIENFHKKYDISKEDILDLFGLDDVDLYTKEHGDSAFSCTSHLWKTLIIYILTEKRKCIFPIKYIENELKKYIKIFNFQNHYDKGINHVDNRHYWNPISNFLKFFCKFDNKRKVWIVNDHIFNAFKHEKLTENNSNNRKIHKHLDEELKVYNDVIEKQILKKLKVNDEVRFLVEQAASTTNAFNYECIDIDIFDLEVYFSERFAWFGAALVFKGKHDRKSPFKGSNVTVDIYAGYASLDDNNKFLVESVSFDKNNNECCKAYINNRETKLDIEWDDEDECEGKDEDAWKAYKKRLLFLSKKENFKRSMLIKGFVCQN